MYDVTRQLCELPLSRAIVGARLHGQYLVVDPPMNQLGLVTTNAATLTIGGYR